MPMLPGIPGPLTDYPAETTRAALHLVLSGHTVRFGRTKIILSHGGGFLPYAATRFAELSASLNPARSVEWATKASCSRFISIQPWSLPVVSAQDLLAFGATGPHRVRHGFSLCIRKGIEEVHRQSEQVS